MKKQMAALLSVSLAGAMCVGIAACGFGSAQSGGQQFSADTFDASWAAAFDEANFENFKATWRTDYSLKFSGPRPEDWEEMGPESMAETAFLPMAATSLALALALALGSKDPGAFFHIFALMTGLCASFGWLFAFPLLFAKTARHLQMNGGAIAGWAGAWASCTAASRQVMAGR